MADLAEIQTQYNQCKAARPKRDCKDLYYQIKTAANVAKLQEKTLTYEKKLAKKDIEKARKGKDPKAYEKAVQTYKETKAEHAGAKVARKQIEVGIQSHGILARIGRGLKSIGGGVKKAVKKVGHVAKVGAIYVGGGVKSVAKKAVKAVKVVGRGVKHAAGVAKAVVKGGLEAGKEKRQAQIEKAVAAKEAKRITAKKPVEETEEVEEEPLTTPEETLSKASRETSKEEPSFT